MYVRVRDRMEWEEVDLMPHTIENPKDLTRSCLFSAHGLSPILSVHTANGLSPIPSVHTNSQLTSPPLSHLSTPILQRLVEHHVSSFKAGVVSR